MKVSINSNLKMETPTPVVFETLPGKDSFGNKAVKSLNLTHFKIDYFKPENGNGYYVLTSDSDPSHPLRLYQSAMDKLPMKLGNAFSSAKELEASNLPDNKNFDNGIINSYGSMIVRLVSTTFKQKVNIWLRLYTLNENRENLPTRTGVRFSLEDNLETLTQFISENK